MTTEAEQKAKEIVADAQTRGERVESEARVNAEKLTGDAEARAAQVDADAVARRAELFSTLEAERDDLSTRVDHLREFEGRFRQSFVGNLEQQLEALRSGSFAPEQLPELLGEGLRGQSATPRLDALLNKDN